MLSVLARVRFPERPATPNPVPPVLAQLRPASPFEAIATAIADLESAVGLALVRIFVNGVPHAALRLDDFAFTILDAHPQYVVVDGAEVPIAARDRASGLAAIRLPLQAASPRTASLRSPGPQFLVAANATSAGIALRPVFVGGLTEFASATWSGATWALPADVNLETGTFLFTVEGAAVGVAAAAAGRRILVPVDVLKGDGTALTQQEPRAPGALPFLAQPLTPALRAATGVSSGVVVTWVDPEGPLADQLRATDVVEQLDGQIVRSWEHWSARIARLAEGEVVRLAVRRRGEVLEVLATAQHLAAPATDGSLGLTLRPARGGAEVVRVAPGSAAAAAGVQAGDLITVFGEVVAPTPSQVRRTFDAGDEGAESRPIPVAVTRGTAHLVVSLERPR
jgi:hypothetical protein